MDKSYIHLFNSVAEYEEARKNNYYEPWVSYTEGVGGGLAYDKTEHEKLLEEPLTFSILDDNTTLSIGQGPEPGPPVSFAEKTIEYSTDKENWISITSSTGGTSFGPFAAGTEVYLRGNNDTLSNFENGMYRSCCKFNSTGRFAAKGNIMSLLSSTGYTTMTEFVSGGVFTQLFYQCTGLTSAENLILPATTLAQGCYYYMFQGCTNLAIAPELPAATLAGSCYAEMFQGCTNLAIAPELPATTLGSYCYNDMFQGCTSLTAAPSILPATTLAEGCYTYMFAGCTSLTSAPALPATTLTGSCYSNMFRNCTSLTAAPVLPATTLAASCYYCMFYGCSGLTSAPALPATTLSNSCYSSMFYGCKSLTTASELPASTMTSGCYNNMFNGCTSLTTAPALPATTLAQSCYRGMFSGCSSLNYIKCLATNISASNCTTDWVNGVSSTGTFVKATSMTSWTTGANGIPSNWTVQDA